MRTVRKCILLCAALSFCLNQSAFTQEYWAIKLPSVPNLGSTWDFQTHPIQAINDRGEILAVTGDAETGVYASYLFSGFRWRPIVYSDSAGNHPTSAVDLNNRGDLLLSWPFGPFIFSRDRLLPLPSDPVLFPSRFNDRGEVVGFFNAPGLQAHAFLLGRGEFRDLGPAWPDNVPLINDRGQVAFTAALPHPWVVWQLAAYVISKTKTNDIGTLGGWDASPLGFNNRGDVVGVSETADLASHAFAYIDGNMIDLTPDEDYGEAVGINDRQTVIGWWQKAGAIGAFVYQDRKRRDLRDVVDGGTNWDFGVPTVINKFGLIGGFGTYEGKSVGYVLIPKLSHAAHALRLKQRF